MIFKQDNLYWSPIAQGTKTIPSSTPVNSSSTKTTINLQLFTMNMKWGYFIVQLILHIIFITTIAALTVKTLVKNRHITC